MLREDEGVKKYPYDDKTGREVFADIGHITIGVGRDLHSNPLSDDEVDYLLTNDIQSAMEIAYKVFPDFEHYEENRQLALINMIFNLGETGFRKFIKLIDAVKNKNWPLAAYEAGKSFWSLQTGNRAKRVVEMLLHNSFTYCN